MIVSLVGGIILAVSALLFVWNLATLHRRGAARAGRRPCLMPRRSIRRRALPVVAQRLRPVEPARRAADAARLRLSDRPILHRPAAAGGRAQAALRWPTHPPNPTQESPPAHRPSRTRVDRPLAALGDRRSSSRRAVDRRADRLGHHSRRPARKCRSDMESAMRRAAGLEPGSPAVAQPLSRATVAARQPGQLGSGDHAASSRPAIPSAARSSPPRSAPPATATRACRRPQHSRASPGRARYAIYKQLHDYRTGARAHPQMTGVAKALRSRDLASVAAYFAAASKEYAALGVRDLSARSRSRSWPAKATAAAASRPASAATSTASGGPIETPVITGQSQRIYARATQAYADGARKNDVYGRMREIARKLTPAGTRGAGALLRGDDLACAAATRSLAPRRPPRNNDYVTVTETSGPGRSSPR